MIVIITKWTDKMMERRTAHSAQHTIHIHHTCTAAAQPCGGRRCVMEKTHKKKPLYPPPLAVSGSTAASTSRHTPAIAASHRASASNAASASPGGGCGAAAEPGSAAADAALTPPPMPPATAVNVSSPATWSSRAFRRPAAAMRAAVASARAGDTPRSWPSWGREEGRGDGRRGWVKGWAGSFSAALLLTVSPTPRPASCRSSLSPGPGICWHKFCPPPPGCAPGRPARRR